MRLKRMKSILIVDDEEGIRKVMRAILENEGYTVLEASGGNEAIVQYGRHGPDLVVTDLLMPGKDGIETLFELRQINCNVKIVALSGGGRICSKNYLNYAMKLGATATIEKPFTSVEFMTIINQAMAIV
jgi:CheY-like chemotaxis protein